MTGAATMTLTGQLRRALPDGWTMTSRNMAHIIRAPEEIAIYFTLPIMFVLVFGYVFGSGMAVPGGGSYREFLLPGVFATPTAVGVSNSTCMIGDGGIRVIEMPRGCRKLARTADSLP